MQKSPTATVSSSSVAPTIVGPDKEMKEIYILGGLVFFLATVVAGFWYYSQTDEAAHSNWPSEAVDNAQVSQALKSQPEILPAVTPAIPIAATAVATRISDVLHDDIFFEIGRKGLTDDGKAALLKHAEFLKQEADWGVLVQGYTDQQGSAHYNKILGQKRADGVKQQLMALGVPETAIRTVSLGEEGALCVDQSDACRRMNRRVHLELRKIGLDHMVIPTVAAPADLDNQPSEVDHAILGNDHTVTGDSLLSSTPSTFETVVPPADVPESDSAH
ncbi:MAG: OmpA family protein [Nitrospiraceae bacterium]|nr:OmpA family protein [Nitrospiraceae bacterium]